MLTFEECREIAQEKAERYRVSISKAYKLGNAYVFYSDIEMTGGFPVVVDTDGQCFGLWHYLNEKDLTMDDMSEIELDKE